MYKDKEKKFTSFFKSIDSKNEYTKEESLQIYNKNNEKEQRNSKPSSFLNNQNMNCAIGKKLSYGRKIFKNNDYFVEKQVKLENFTKVSSDDETKADFSSSFSSSSSGSKKINKKSPTHFLIPYTKRKDEKFKTRIIKKLKGKTKKNHDKDETLDSNIKIINPQKKMKINLNKKIFIEDITLEYFNKKHEKKKKKFTLYQDNEVGFDLDWQDFIISVSIDDDFESDNDIIQKGVSACFWELQQGFNSFYRKRSKSRKGCDK